MGRMPKPGDLYTMVVYGCRSFLVITSAEGTMDNPRLSVAVFDFNRLWHGIADNVWSRSFVAGKLSWERVT